jgi:hypothetical protein
MSIVLPALAVAFAAFCVWLGVRIVNRKERWAKWTLAAALVLVYPLSFGPACWLSDPMTLPVTPGPQQSSDSFMSPFSIAPRCYWPIGWTAKNGPNAVSRCIVWYAELRRGAVALPITASGEYWLTFED